MNDITAGPETDALIAEKVFRNRPTKILAYSTDIAAAWPVFQWVIDLLGPEVVVVVTFDHELNGWLCGPQTELPAVSLAESAPLAICREALRQYGKLVLEESRRHADRQRASRKDHLKLE